jgi:predicted GNAT superfamily acetyltransferase
MIADTAQALIIRDITALAEMREIEQLQKDVWGSDDREIFPAMALVPLIEIGGVLMGAFAGERMAGFVLGVPGLENGRVILHSDMLAVRPEYRAAGLGYKLKLAQRERALAKGIDTVTWTFDPLQSLNAHLNFGKLGVVAESYRINYYGETTSFLHQTGTDRLWVTWRLDSRRVHDRLESGAGPVALNDEVRRVLRVAQGNEPDSISLDAGNEQLLTIEIPTDINRLLKENPALASRWRTASRAAFSSLLTAGFVVTDFCRVERSQGKVGQYRLEREPGARATGTKTRPVDLA